MKRIDCHKMIGAKMMQRGFSCLLGLIVLFSIVSFCFPTNGYGVEMEKVKMVETFKRANPLFLSGQKYFVKEKYGKSREALEKCIEIMPEYADAWFLLAQIENKENNIDKAMEDIQKAKQNFKFVAKFQTQTHEQYTDSLRKQKVKLEEQLSLLADKMSDPDSKMDAAQKQAMLVKVREMKRNIELIDREIRATNVTTIDIDLPAEYFFIHGNIFFKLRQFNEARDQYIEVIQRDPTHANAYNNLINLYFITGNHQKAMDYLNQAETNGANVNQKLKEALLAALK